MPSNESEHPIEPQASSESEARLVRMRQRIDELEGILNSLDCAVVAERLDGTIRLWNPSAQRLLGYDSSEVLGAESGILVPADRMNETADASRRARAGEILAPFTSVRRHRDGGLVEVTVAISPLIGSSAREVVGIVSSLRATERKSHPDDNLREAREVLQIILDGIPQGLFWKDLSLRYLGCNLRAARDAGLEHPSQIVGRTDFELAWKKLAEAYRGDDRAVLAVGDSKLNYEEELINGEGRITHVATSKVPLRTPTGETFGILGMYEDITARRDVSEALRLSEERFALAMLGTADGLWDWDPIADKVTFSTRLKAIVGVESSELGDSIEAFHQLVHPDDAARFQTLLRDHLQGNSERFELKHRLRHRDGSYRFVLSRGFAVRSSPQSIPNRFVGTLIDITELTSAQSLLEQAVDDLKRSNRELEQFAYVASHDLQEPLRMVASYTQLLADRYRGKLDEKAQRYIEHAVDGARRMQGLINDLLTLARIGSQVLPTEAVDCREVVGQVLRELAATIGEKRAEIRVGPLPVVQARRGQLQQVFQNLIANALKFHGDAPPRIEIGATMADTDYVFEVRDNGIGIDSKYADRIFVIFQRLHARDSYPGSGIGLAIAKKIIERHRGRIWVESTLGEGACFRFTIPFGAPNSEETS